MNRTGGDLQKVSLLCMNELYTVLSVDVAISCLAKGLAYTVTVDFKEVARSSCRNAARGKSISLKEFSKLQAKYSVILCLEMNAKMKL